MAKIFYVDFRSRKALEIKVTFDPQQPEVKADSEGKYLGPEVPLEEHCPSPDCVEERGNKARGYDCGFCGQCEVCESWSSAVRKELEEDK